jgi:hypothetical protein
VGLELENLRLAEGEGPDAALLAEALSGVEQLGEVVKEATPQELRNALRPLVERVTVHFTEGKYDRVDVTLSKVFVNLLSPACRTCSRTMRSCAPTTPR